MRSIACTVPADLGLGPESSRNAGQTALAISDLKRKLKRAPRHFNTAQLSLNFMSLALLLPAILQ